MEISPSFKQIIINEQDLHLYYNMIDALEAMDNGDIDYHTLGCEKNQQLGILALKKLAHYKHHIQEFAYLFDIEIMMQSSKEEQFIEFIQQFKIFTDSTQEKNQHFSILRVVGKSSNLQESSYIGLAINQTNGILIARMQDQVAINKQEQLLKNCIYLVEQFSSFLDPQNQEIRKFRRISLDLTLTGEIIHYKQFPSQQILHNLFCNIRTLALKHQIQEFCINQFERNCWERYIKDLKDYCNCGCCLNRWRQFYQMNHIQPFIRLRQNLLNNLDVFQVNLGQLLNIGHVNEPLNQIFPFLNIPPQQQVNNFFNQPNQNQNNIGQIVHHNIPLDFIQNNDQDEVQNDAQNNDQNDIQNKNENNIQNKNENDIQNKNENNNTQNNPQNNNQNNALNNPQDPLKNAENNNPRVSENQLFLDDIDYDLLNDNAALQDNPEGQLNNIMIIADEVANDNQNENNQNPNSPANMPPNNKEGEILKNNQGKDNNDNNAARNDNNNNNINNHNNNNNNADNNHNNNNNNEDNNNNNNNVINVDVIDIPHQDIIPPQNIPIFQMANNNDIIIDENNNDIIHKLNLLEMTIKQQTQQNTEFLGHFYQLEYFLQIKGNLIKQYATIINKYKNLIRKEILWDMLEKCFFQNIFKNEVQVRNSLCIYRHINLFHH